MSILKRTSAEVTAYIAARPPKHRKALRQLRQAIKGVSPSIREKMSYGIPTFTLDDKYLLYIAAFKEHVSMYPATRGMAAKHAKAMAKYRHGAGTLRFALDEALPLTLVQQLAKVRIQERQA